MTKGRDVALTPIHGYAILRSTMAYRGILGLLALLALAWLISYHRRRLPVRTVLWGLGLQFLFAVIILKGDAWSFAGMALLGLLVGTYLLERPPSLTSGRPARTVIVLGFVTLIAAAAAHHETAAAILTVTAVATALLMRFTPLSTAVSRLTSVAAIGLGLAWMMAAGLDGRALFSLFSDRVAAFLGLAEYGARFLFDELADPEGSLGLVFAFSVLPTIIFFGAVMSVLYYLGIVQRIVVAMSRFLRWTIGTSGAETLSCSANIFVGQTEAPLLIKPFLLGMTRSELLTIMVGGFATIAGGVLAGYIAFGIPASHLIAASVMSAPAALMIGKIIYPETEMSATGEDVEMPRAAEGDNLIEAATQGILDGLKLAVTVGAMLIGFIALIAVVDVILGWGDAWIDGVLLDGSYRQYAAQGMSPATGEYEGIFPGSLQTLFGTLLAPLAWLMGVAWSDAGAVGNLLGVKLSLNEFVAYGTLEAYMEQGVLSARSVVIATYALCGFANVASIGIQIGGISSLVPERRSELAALGFKAMLGGAFASWTTATIAGLLIG